MCKGIMCNGKVSQPTPRFQGLSLDIHLADGRILGMKSAPKYHSESDTFSHHWVFQVFNVGLKTHTAYEVPAEDVANVLEHLEVEKRAREAANAANQRNGNGNGKEVV